MKNLEQLTLIIVEIELHYISILLIFVMIQKQNLSLSWQLNSIVIQCKEVDNQAACFKTKLCESIIIESQSL